MTIKVLFVVLVLCTIALAGVAIASFLHVRRHLTKPSDGHHGHDKHAPQ